MNNIKDYYYIIYYAVLIIHCINNNSFIFINDYKIKLYQYTNNINILNKDLTNKQLKTICNKIIIEFIKDALRYNNIL